MRLVNAPISGLLAIASLVGDGVLPGDVALLMARRCTDGRSDIELTRLFVGDIARLTGSDRDIVLTSRYPFSLDIPLNSYPSVWPG